MSSSIMAYYSSEYSEPRKGLYSLGGGPNTLLSSRGEVGVIFNPIEEYESTNIHEDYRIIYLTNTAKNYTIIKSFSLVMEFDHTAYIDKSTRLHLSNITMRMFVPPYGGVGYVHPVITSRGVFRDTGIAMRDIIREEATQLNYGVSVVVKQDIKAGEFIPIVLQRTAIGPIPFLKNLRFTISSLFAVG